MSYVFNESIYEAFTSELLENLEEIFLRYYMHSEMFGMFTSPTTHYRVMVAEGTPYHVSSTLKAILGSQAMVGEILHSINKNLWLKN